MTKSRSNATAPNAKGTLVVGNGTDASTTLAVASTAGYVLTVDSGEATGLKWAAPSSPSFAGCRLIKTSGNQSVADSTYVAVTWNSESFDSDAYHDTSTNTSRITIPAGKGGYYRFSWQVNVGTGSTFVALLYKNGSRVTYGVGQDTYYESNTTIAAGAVGDYFEIYVRQTTGVSKTITDETNGATGITWFDCEYLGA